MSIKGQTALVDLPELNLVSSARRSQRGESFNLSGPKPSVLQLCSTITAGCTSREYVSKWAPLDLIKIHLQIQLGLLGSGWRETRERNKQKPTKQTNKRRDTLLIQETKEMEVPRQLGPPDPEQKFKSLQALLWVLGVGDFRVIQ